MGRGAPGRRRGAGARLFQLRLVQRLCRPWRSVQGGGGAVERQEVAQAERPASEVTVISRRGAVGSLPLGTQTTPVCEVGVPPHAPTDDCRRCPAADLRVRPEALVFFGPKRMTL